MNKTYVVFVGRNPGVYDRWAEANAQVYRFSGACYKGYESREASEKAFNCSVKQPVEIPNFNDSSSSTSTTTEQCALTKIVNKKLVELLKEFSDLVRENRNIVVKMEKLSDEIGKLLEDLEINDVP